MIKSVQKQISGPFLNRNLLYNKKGNQQPVEEYYLHTISNNQSFNEMIEYINSFKKKQKNDTYNDIFTLVNKDTYISDYTDKDFYIQSLTCLFCRRKFFGFIGLFYHMIIIHENYEFYYDYRKNSDGLSEAHIIAIYKNNMEDLQENYDFDFYLRVNKCKLLKTINNKIIKHRIHYDLNDEKIAQKSKPKEGKVKLYPRNESERIFFHSVTGQILHEDSEDSDYSIDDEDLKDYEEKDIDNFTDVCESDKKFMKLWNKFIRTVKDKTVSKMPTILEEFLETFHEEISQSGLIENFYLHLINLHDHQQINKENFISISKLFQKMNIEKFKK